MEPLGFYMYFKNNKKKVLTIIVTLVLSAFLIVVIGAIGNSASKTLKIYANQYNYFSALWTDKNKIPKGVIDELKNNPHVDRIVEGSSVNGEIKSIMGNSVVNSGMEIDKNDLGYILSKMDINIVQTDMDYGDVIGSKMLLRNVGVKVGDTVGNEKYGFSRLEGRKLIKADYDKELYMFFILNKKENIGSYNGQDLYIFPKDGQLEKLNKSLKKYSNKEIHFGSKDNIDEDIAGMIASFKKLLNIFSITVIIIISVILGNSYYLHYMERRREFGTLKALGYKRAYILKRMIKEITLVNFIGALIYFGLLEVFIKGMNKFYMVPKGLPNLELYKEGIFSLILLPVFVFIFSLIPIYVLLSNMDSISIIERME